MTEPGQYYGTLNNAVTTTARTGSLQLVLEFTITHGPGEVAIAASFDKRVYCSLTDSAMPYTRERLLGLGFNGNFDEPAFEKDGAWLNCSHEMYNGRLTERWELPGAGGELVKCDATALQRLNAIWRAENEQSAPPPPPPPAANKDDIPF